MLSTFTHRFSAWLCLSCFFGACTSQGSQPALPAATEASPPKVSVHAPAAEATKAPSTPTAAAACLHEGPGCDQEAPPTAATSGHFGEPFTLTRANTLGEALAAVASLPEGQASDLMQVHGEIGPVCQKKGCWMMLRAGEHSVRVTMARGAFSVPRDGQGKQATVEGTLKARHLSAAQVEHLAQDEGKAATANAAAQPRREYVLTAHAVEVM